jgi:hypothetical protein
MLELIELRRVRQDTEGDNVTGAEWLVILARDISKVLVDLGMPPNQRIPQDSCMVGDILVALDVILEHLWEAYSFGHNP